MDDFANLPRQDRADLFRAVSEKRSIGPGLIEKDFWVCWMLRRMYQCVGLPGILFKGGTSLSKVYRAIQRFSEDIDLSLDRAALGFDGVNDPTKVSTGKQRKRKLEQLSEACRHCVRDSVLPMLTKEVEKVLPDRSRWQLVLAEDDEERFTLSFAYPSSLAEVPAYVRPQVRLEFGARSDHWPSIEADVAPYVAEDFPAEFKSPGTRVKVLAGERTFWEKATALHAWHSKPTNAVTERRSRHYYDLVCLYECEIGKRALADHKLLQDVVRHKTTFFAAASSHYELAKPGTFAVLPPGEHLQNLRQDYVKTAEMIFGAPPSFDHILNGLARIDKVING